MSLENPDSADFAVVGGGVSGLYTAWRLAAANPDARVVLLEQSDRLGGRLWSVGMRREKVIPAELGGMFFSDAQTLVYDLCTASLDLPREAIVSRPDFAYLRGKRFRIEDFSKPSVLPYHLAPDEQGMAYHELLLYALKRILPDLDQHWPLNKDGSMADTVHYLRSAEFQGRSLRHWGFWNLLSKVISNEAYLCLRDLVSSYSLFSNWNGQEAIFSTLMDLTGNWFRLPDGYQKLAIALGEQFEQHGGEIRFQSKVTDIQAGNGAGGVTLALDQKGKVSRIDAGRVVLAIPKTAIKSLDPDSIVLQDVNTRNLLESVDSVPACKIFMTFDRPWWREVPDGPGRIDKGSLAISHTDLPMRQCYYLGTNPDTGEGLLLASYGDAQSVPFWSALMSDSGRYDDLETTVPEFAREEIRRQLSEMHDYDVPAARQALYVDWGALPFGGGWHAWRPGWDSREVMQTLRRPMPEVNLHVCGESYCSYQSWVEGALTSAEVLLQDDLGLDAPDWLSSKDCLAPYHP